MYGMQVRKSALPLRFGVKRHLVAPQNRTLEMYEAAIVFLTMQIYNSLVRQYYVCIYDFCRPSRRVFRIGSKAGQKAHCITLLPDMSEPAKALTASAIRHKADRQDRSARSTDQPTISTERMKEKWQNTPLQS